MQDGNFENQRNHSGLKMRDRNEATELMKPQWKLETTLCIDVTRNSATSQHRPDFLAKSPTYFVPYRGRLHGEALHFYLCRRPDSTLSVLCIGLHEHTPCSSTQPRPPVPQQFKFAVRVRTTCRSLFLKSQPCHVEASSR